VALSSGHLPDVEFVQRTLNVSDFETQHSGASALKRDFATGNPVINGAQAYAEMNSNSDTVSCAVRISDNFVRPK